MASQEVITVTGWRIPTQDGGPTMQLYAERVSTDESGGGGSTSTVLDTKEKLADAIRGLGNDDKIIIKIGKMTAVIDGLDKDKFFERAFSVVSRIMTGIEQGTLRDELLAAFPKKAAWVNDLIDDFLSMGENGRYVRITNVADLASVARQHGAGAEEQANATETGAFTVAFILTETMNFDKNTATTQYHQIYLDTSNIGSHRPSSGSRINQGSKYVSLEVQLIHELFHIAEGESHSNQEFAKFGVSNTSSNGHDTPFDQMGSRVFNFIKGRSELGVAPSVQTTEGGDGNDTLTPATGGYHLVDIDAGAGDDIVSLALKGGTLVGGAGNDVFTVTPGSGMLFLSAGAGSDTLSVPNGGAYGATVEVVDGWVYLGFRSDPNHSASETDNFVYWRLGTGPEEIVIGGTTYSESDMQGLSNSKPMSYYIPTLTLQAPWYHGFVFDIGGFDPDGDALTHTILGVSGKGSDSQWWLSGSSLYTSFTHAEQGHIFYTKVTLRVSDGEFHHDYELDIEWHPDPNGGFEMYSYEDREPEWMHASDRLGSDFFLNHPRHSPAQPERLLLPEPGPHVIDDIGSLFVI